jgi:hypothetical protein
MPRQAVSESFYMCVKDSPAKATQKANLGQYCPLQNLAPQKTYVTPLSNRLGETSQGTVESTLGMPN